MVEQCEKHLCGDESHSFTENTIRKDFSENAAAYKEMDDVKLDGLIQKILRFRCIEGKEWSQGHCCLGDASLKDIE